MAINKALEMAGNMFNYENPCCDCKVTTNYTEDGMEVHSIQLKTTDYFYKYAYAPIDGLVMIDNKTGSIIEKNKVIEDFLNIDPRFYVSTSKSIIKALINMRSFEIQLSPIG